MTDEELEKELEATTFRDYCTCFPDVFKGIDISSACKLHDNMCGEKGSYWFFDTIAPFYKALRELGVSKKSSVMITTGGTIIYAIKFIPLCIAKHKYRKKIKD